MTHVLKWGVGLVMALGAVTSGCASASEADTNTSWSKSGEPPRAADGARTTGASLTHVGTLNLTREGMQANVPSLRWLEDRFVVAWISATLRGEFFHVTRAEVTPEGEASVTEAENETYVTSDVVLGVAGDISVSTGSGFNGECVIETYDQSVTKVTEDHFPCRSRASVVSVGPGQWHASHTEAIAGDPQNAVNVIVGHFEPGWSDPISGTATLGTSHEDTVPYLYLDGVEAAVVWSTGAPGAEIHRLHGVQASGASSMSTAVVTGLNTEGSYGFGTLGGRSLVFGQNGSELWTADVTAPSGPSPSKVLGQSGVSDREVGVAAAEELGVFGVCYATGLGPAGGSGSDGVSFVVLNAEGDVVAGPIVIEDGFPNIGACQVAWSGSEFAVAYWRIDLPTSSSMRLAKIDVSL